MTGCPDIEGWVEEARNYISGPLTLPGMVIVGRTGDTGYHDPEVYFDLPDNYDQVYWAPLWTGAEGGIYDWHLYRTASVFKDGVISRIRVMGGPLLVACTTK